MFLLPPGSARRGVVIVVLSLLVVAAVYRKTPMNFFRAESGWFLVESVSSKERQDKFQRDFFMRSYGGHYTPLAFIAEFQAAKLAGTNESFWKWRQILVLGLVAAALCGTVSGIASLFQLSRWGGWAIGAALAAGAVFRPEVMELISWPFMIFQLLWIAFFIPALYAAVRVASAPEQSRWPWIAVLSACASLQVSGLGLVTVAAVSAVFFGLLLVAMHSPSAMYGPHRKRIATALITLLGVAAIHGWAMLHLLPPHPTFSAPFRSICRLFLGFIANLAAAAAHTFMATAISEPDWRSLGYAWPYGVLVIAASVLLIFWLVRKAFREPTPRNLTWCALHIFSISAFFAFIGLAAVRQLQAAPSLDQAWMSLTYTTVYPRYIVPLHFTVIGSAIGAAVWLMQRAPRLAPAAFAVLVLAAITAQKDFQVTTFPYREPVWRISHGAAWRLVLATVRECRMAQLPVPNIPLGVLTQGWMDADMRVMEPLIRRDLRLAPEEKMEMIGWEEYTAQRERYATVPSLRLLEAKMLRYE